MNTLLPYPDFQKSAKALDWKRLGKQRVEIKQILEINFQVDKVGEISWEGAEFGKFRELSPYENHPAVLQWRNSDITLTVLGLTCCKEWMFRGYNDNLSGYFWNLLFDKELSLNVPEWLGDKRFHQSHQSKLLFKGSVDSLVETIEKYRGERYFKWRKELNLPQKNQINHEQRDLLKELASFYKMDLQPNWYEQFGWEVPDDLEYFWPVRKGE